MLRMYWNAGFESVFGCTSLESLFVFSPPDADLSRFGTLPALRRLELSQGRKLVSTQGVGELDFLGLYQQGALAELADLPGSVACWRSSPQRSWRRSTRVAGCRSLRRLDIANCGEIASLKPLAGLDALEDASAPGSRRASSTATSPCCSTLPRLREAAACATAASTARG